MRWSQEWGGGAHQREKNIPSRETSSDKSPEEEEEWDVSGTQSQSDYSFGETGKEWHETRGREATRQSLADNQVDFVFCPQCNGKSL